MPTKVQPWMRVYCWPLSPQSAYVGMPFGFSDYLADLIDRAQGSEGGYAGSTGQGAGSGNQIIEASNLRWWNLNDDTDKTRLCGYTVDTRYQPLSSILDGDTSINPPTGVPALVWTPKAGHEERWQTCLPDSGPACTGLRQSNLDMAERTGATTNLSLPRNQSFRVTLQLLGAAQNDNAGEYPWLRLTWGGGHVLNWDLGRQPEYGFAASAGSSGAASSGYTARRTLPWAASLWNYSELQFDVLYLGGRLCFFGNDGTTIYTERPRGLNAADTPRANQEGQVLSVNGQEAPLAVESNGTSYVLRVNEIAHSDLDLTTDDLGATTGAETNTTGYFRRQYYSGQAPVGVSAYASGHNPALEGGSEEHPDKLAIVTDEGKPVGSGWQGQSALRCDLTANVSAGQAVSLTPLSWRTDLLEYAGKAMRGHSSPLIHSISCHAPTRWRTITSADPVDIAPAIDSATENCADPNLQHGSRWHFDLDRMRLLDLAAPTGGSLGENWQSYVNRDQRIRVEVAWTYDDGVRRAYPYQGGSAASSVSRLYGYQTARGDISPQANKRPLSLDACDPIFRLQAPAAIIGGADAQCAALDFLYANKLAAARPGRKTVLYGADCIQYLLRTLQGDATAEALQVYYPGWAGLWGNGRRVVNGQWGLIEYLTYTNPPSGGGLIFPPPYGQDALSWMGKIGELDFAVFFYGRSETDPTNVAPCYGNYFSYVYNRLTTDLPDAVYLTDDANIAIFSGETQQVTERDYNSWTFWGSAPGQNNLGGVLPAIPAFSATSTVLAGSPIEAQNALLTWVRTSIKQGTQYYLPGIARALAQYSYLMFWGVPTRRNQVKCRGNEWLWWGDKVTIKTNPDTGESDPQMVHLMPGSTTQQQKFRVMRVRNEWRFGEKASWDTHLTLADQSTYFENAYWGSGG